MLLRGQFRHFVFEVHKYNIYIFRRCSCVASPENFGFTAFFEVRKSYRLRMKLVISFCQNKMFFWHKVLRYPLAVS